MPRAVTLVPALALTALAGMTARCERDRPAPVPASHARRSTSAVIYFEADAFSPDAATLAALRPIARAARSNPTARIVVQGFANERQDLQGNLDLAERRARGIARQLLAWSVMDSQITLAAAEADATDEKGARCEVELVEDAVAASNTESPTRVASCTMQGSMRIARPYDFANAALPDAARTRVEFRLASLINL